MEYDSAWPRSFERLRQRVFEGVAHLGASVEHVGSTSVPSLASEPLLDIDVIVKTPHDVPAAIDALGARGYWHRGDLGIPGREAFGQPRAADPRHHLYLVIDVSKPRRDHIDFRDFL